MKADGCEKVIWLMLNASTNNGLVITLSLFLPDPMNTRYYYHFLAENEARGWLYWAWSALEYATELLTWSPWMLTLFSFWMYAKSTTFWLQQIKCDLQFSCACEPYVHRADLLYFSICNFQVWNQPTFHK